MIDSFTISNLPETTLIVYRNIAARTIQMMPRKPDSVPNANAETAEGSGILNARHETANAAMTPKNAAYGAEMPRCLTPCWSRCGCRAMKYNRTRIGTAATSVDSIGLPNGS